MENEQHEDVLQAGSTEGRLVVIEITKSPRQVRQLLDVRVGLVVASTSLCLITDLGRL